MDFALHVPAPPLDAIIESITYFAGATPSHHREKLIPDCAIQIVVDLTDVAKEVYADETGPALRDFRNAWISGTQRKWIVIEAQQHASMLVIRFRPGGARCVLGHDADPLADGVFALDDVVGQAAVSLRERVLDADGVTAKMAAAEAWLHERLRAGVDVHPTIVYLARRLHDPIGLRIRDLADEVGFSERHLLALFRRWLGVTPKQYARIRRFQTMLQRLGHGRGVQEADIALEGAPLEAPNWAEMAVTFGYADQPHLNHEFRAFAGMTPGAYLRAYRGLDNYLPIDLPRRQEFRFLQDQSPAAVDSHVA